MPILERLRLWLQGVTRAALAAVASVVRAAERLPAAGAWLLAAPVRLYRWIAAPVMALWRAFHTRSLWVKIAVAVIVIPWFLGYAAFMWEAAFIRGYDPDYANTLGIEKRTVLPGKPISAADPKTCGQSYIVAATAALIDFEVATNGWLPSNPFYKMGFFGIAWERTKFFDNKAAFEKGVHQAVGRTAIELAETLGRVRGTSEIDPDLVTARGNVQTDPATWYFNLFGTQPFGPTTSTPTYFRKGGEALRRYQARLVTCQATFDARADNLHEFVDRIASDIGSTTAGLAERAETHHSGWFDTRADDMFYFAQGQLYAYYGILKAAHADFAEVITTRDIGAIWDNLEQPIRHALSLSPLIVSNGAEDSWIMPSHLGTIGFYMLRARSNLVEMRQVLER